MKNGLFLKKKNSWGGGGRGVIELGHAFMKTPLEFSIFFTLPLEIPDKTKLQPWKFHKFLLPTSLGNSKTKNQNPWLEIPHYFFLVTLGNSTLFLITPENSTCYFFDSLIDTPGNSISSTPPVWFFLEWANRTTEHQQKTFVTLSGF